MKAMLAAVCVLGLVTYVTAYCNGRCQRQEDLAEADGDVGERCVCRASDDTCHKEHSGESCLDEAGDCGGRCHNFGGGDRHREQCTCTATREGRNECRMWRNGHDSGEHCA